MIAPKQGSICAPKGFVAGGIHCGIRKNQSKRDLGIIYSPTPCTAAAVYTKNKVAGAPIVVTKTNLEDGMAQAVVVNSGNANTCNANGIQIAQAMCDLTAKALGIKADDVIVASTGVIGQPLEIEPIEKGIEMLAPTLSDSGNDAAAEAIMTTDLKPKSVAVSTVIDGKEVIIGGIAKGSGMIHPNMATMLGFLTTDAAISAPMLQKALSSAVDDTFNMISVDGDTSTNDMVSIMANGQAENAKITAQGPDFDAFLAALKQVCAYLAKCIAADGEGATKLIVCNVYEAPTTALAKGIAKSVICSSLVKTAIFGSDANWGRILCAIGYAEGDFSVDTIAVSIGSKAGEIQVCENGSGIEFSEEKAKEILLQDEISLNIFMGQGTGAATAWGCDLTYDYVRINGDYRS